MKKIMFNDKYGLTDAVLKGRKTMTRRIIPIDICNATDWKAFNEGDMKCYGTGDGDWVDIRRCASYKIGEIVAVAQNYQDAIDNFNGNNDIAGWGKLIANTQNGSVGYYNKMFTRADLMPHHIRITDIKLERLQDISNEDVYKEGFTHEFVNNNWGNSAYHEETMLVYYDNKGLTKQIRSREPKEAFSFLIDKVSGNGTWERNPWVFVYTFELID